MPNKIYKIRIGGNMAYLFGLWMSAAIGFLIGAVWCGMRLRDRFSDVREFGASEIPGPDKI